MEFFNSFLADKFAAVAAEIFQVFKDTIDTYKGEIELIKQENRKLKETLGHINNHIQEQTVFLDADGMHNLNPDPTVIDEPSLLQVKLEVAGVKKAGPRRLVRRMSPRTSELEKNDYLEQNRFLEDTIENNQHMDSFLVKQEPCTSRGLHLEPPEDSSESEFNDTSTGHQSDAHCNQLFNDPSHLALPLLSHLTLFACKVCGKSFKRQNKLRTHMALHRNEQNHVCHVCEKSFVSISVLNVHLMSHTNERRFGCSFCDKRFKLKSHLKEHERIHTGERPFSCPVCRRSFSRSNSMKNHFRNSHREHFQSEEPQLSDI